MDELATLRKTVELIGHVKLVPVVRIGMSQTTANPFETEATGVELATTKMYDIANYLESLSCLLEELGYRAEGLDFQLMNSLAWSIKRDIASPTSGFNHLYSSSSYYSKKMADWFGPTARADLYKLSRLDRFIKIVELLRIRIPIAAGELCQNILDEKYIELENLMTLLGVLNSEMKGHNIELEIRPNTPDV